MPPVSRNSLLFKAVAASLFLFAAQSCAKKKPVPTPPPGAGAPSPLGGAPAGATAVQAVGPATAPAAEAAVPKEEYHYDPYGKPDPFEPFLIPGAGIEVQGPLATVDLAQLVVKGIIWGSVDERGHANPRALVMDPSGKTWILRVGFAPVGRNKGEVVAINRDGIEVLEKITDLTGQVVKTQKQLLKAPPDRR